MSSVTDIAYAPAGDLIDVEALLAPLPGDSPAGADLQYAGLHDEIREARRADDTLEQGDWKRQPKLADWLLVEQLAADALTHRTKDLRVGAWLCEALVKLYGFRGLRDGLRMMRGLLELYWDYLYPAAEDGELEARANTLEWLERQLAVVMRELPLTKTSVGGGYTFFQYAGAQQFDIPEHGGGDPAGYNKLRELAEREGKITTEDWRKAKQATARAFYEETDVLLDACWLEFEALDRTVDEKFGAQTPGLSTLKRVLDDLRALVKQIVKEKRLLEPDAAPDAASNPAPPAPRPAKEAVPITAGQIETREIAVQRLAEIAEYFRRAEPHSPVSYLVQRAVRWAQMPLELWLQEVIKDGSVLGDLRETLGMAGSAEEKFK
jgi:type VI secretion system protein ImpA